MNTQLLNEKQRALMELGAGFLGLCEGQDNLDLSKDLMRDLERVCI